VVGRSQLVIEHDADMRCGLLKVKIMMYNLTDNMREEKEYGCGVLKCQKNFLPNCDIEAGCSR